MEFSVKYFKDYVSFTVPDANVAGELLPHPCPAVASEEDELRRALSHPIGTKGIADIVKPGEKTVIITSDVTRPIPSWIVVPCVLEELAKAGVNNEDVTVVFGLGSHRKQTEEEQRRLVGDAVFDRVRCIDSDPDDVVHLGVCKNGTPVDIFRTVAEADRRILLGNVEYHYFAGYSGGMKAIMPGVSSRTAIETNHGNMVRPGSYSGNMEGNPVRDDMEEVYRYCPADFILNVVLDDHKKIAFAVAGHPVAAHRKACKFLDAIYKIEIPGPADMVIVSTGGYPKDINLYQAQKSIDNAKHAVKEGGVMIVAASCKEGYGSDVFARWIETYKTPAERIQHIQQHFELGGHKAAALAMVQEKADIYFVTDMDEDMVRAVGMRPFREIQTAVDAAFEKLGRAAKAYIIPIGGSTLPVVKK